MNKYEQALLEAELKQNLYKVYGNEESINVGHLSTILPLTIEWHIMNRWHTYSLLNETEKEKVRNKLRISKDEISRMTGGKI